MVFNSLFPRDVIEFIDISQSFFIQQRNVIPIKKIQMIEIRIRNPIEFHKVGELSSHSFPHSLQQFARHYLKFD